MRWFGPAGLTIAADSGQFEAPLPGSEAGCRVLKIKKETVFRFGGK
jgi:hypothetical protein